MNIVQALVRAVIENWECYEWTTQGFGFVRTKLANVGRIHIWDERVRTPLVSDIHTHPWPLHSQIISGMLVNTRFTEYCRKGVVTEDSEREEAAAIALPYQKHVILTGEGGGLSDKVPTAKVWLEARPAEQYISGAQYKQTAEEIHRTWAENGTVTLLTRPQGPPLETALVYWPEGTQWVSAEPRPATPAEVGMAVEYALDRWSA